MESINSDKIVLIGQKYPIQWRRTGNLLQYSCPGDTMEREAWWATAHGIPRVDIFHLLPSNLPSHFRPALSPQIHKQEALEWKVIHSYLTVSHKQTDEAKQGSQERMSIQLSGTKSPPLPLWLPESMNIKTENKSSLHTLGTPSALSHWVLTTIL